MLTPGAAPLSQPPWDAVLLVCKDCRKRRHGPVKLKAKAVAAELRRVAGGTLPRPRVLLTSCLGVCPKDRMVICRAGAHGAARMALIGSASDVRNIAPLLAAPNQNS